MKAYKSLRYIPERGNMIGEYTIINPEQLSTSELLNYINVTCFYVIKGTVVFQEDYYIDYKNFTDKKNLYYVKHCGKYILLFGDETKFLVFNAYRGSHTFVYNNIQRTYDAYSHLSDFTGMVKMPPKKANYPVKDLKYTFGVEYETSSGIVPEKECFENGLIPLRDGSITANEYATIVLKGNEGFELIKRQVALLNKYTSSDQNCSIHIHLGGFPLHPMYLYTVFSICQKLERSFDNYLPEYSFHTDKYKQTGKNYCAPLPIVDTFCGFYNYFEGTSVRSIHGMNKTKDLPDLFLPHPLDPSGEHKWQIITRYHWINFINALNYNRGKTIEFRFLKPTTNYNIIINWIGVFSYILYTCEIMFKSICDDLGLSHRFVSNSDWRLYETELLKRMNKLKPNLNSLLLTPLKGMDNIGADLYYSFLVYLNQSVRLQSKMQDKIGKYTILNDLIIKGNFANV